MIQNNGRDYDDVTGVFTVPYKETYLFAVQVCSYYEQNTSYTSTSGTVIHWLAKGQEVWVMNYYSSIQLYESYHRTGTSLAVYSFICRLLCNVTCIKSYLVYSILGTRVSLLIIRPPDKNVYYFLSQSKIYGMNSKEPSL